MMMGGSGGGKAGKIVIWMIFSLLFPLFKVFKIARVRFAFILLRAMMNYFRTVKCNWFWKKNVATKIDNSLGCQISSSYRDGSDFLHNSWDVYWFKFPSVLPSCLIFDEIWEYWRSCNFYIAIFFFEFIRALRIHIKFLIFPFPINHCWLLELSCSLIEFICSTFLLIIFFIFFFFVGKIFDLIKISRIGTSLMLFCNFLYFFWVCVCRRVWDKRKTKSSRKLYHYLSHSETFAFSPQLSIPKDVETIKLCGNEKLFSISPHFPISLNLWDFI